MISEAGFLEERFLLQGWTDFNAQLKCEGWGSLYGLCLGNVNGGQKNEF